MDTASLVASSLLRIGAVSLNLDNPFRYASGILSPIYCDNRRMISYPQERRLIVEGLIERLRAEISHKVEVVAGTATAGIPWASFVAWELGLPLVYVRAQAKEHGRGQRVEGVLEAGKRVVVVEDLVTTGGSAISTIEALREEGAEVVGCLTIFTYELERAKQSFNQLGVPLYYLTCLSTLLEVAEGENIVPGERLEELKAAIARAFSS